MRFDLSPYAVRRRSFRYGGFLERRGLRPLASHWHALRRREPKLEAAPDGYQPWPKRNGLPLRAFVPGYWRKAEFYKGRTPNCFYAGIYGHERLRAALRKAFPRD